MEEAVKTLFENSPNLAVILIISLIVYHVVMQAFSFVFIRRDTKKHDKKFDKIEAILVEFSKNFDRIDLRFGQVDLKFDEIKAQLKEHKAQVDLKLEEIKAQLKEHRAQVDLQLKEIK